MINLNSSTTPQSHLQITSEATALTGLLGGVFYGVLIGLPTAFSMAIIERWRLKGYNVKAFQISWIALILVVFLASNVNLGWFAYLLLAIFYGFFIATLFFNNAMKKKYNDDLKNRRAPKSLILQEQEEAQEEVNAPHGKYGDEPDDEWEDDI